MDSNNYYGLGGRLSKIPSQGMIETAFNHDCENGQEVLDGIYIADIAHILHLLDLNLIPEKAALILLQELVATSSDQITLDPKFGDVYNCKDVHIKKTIGKNAGWLHLGRARRESVNVGFILKVRQLVLKFYESSINFSKKLLGIIGETKSICMPDYTYLLHAQPTTLGHYLGTFQSPFMRDLDRLSQYYKRLNQSWAGIGSVNGSSLSINREELARLMAFDKVAMHTRDAMWMPDIINEGFSILTNIFNNLSRLVEDLIVWNSKEFSFIDIDDSYSRASVIMPQKKNPYAFCYVRGLGKDLVGKYTTALMLSQQQSGFPDSRTFVYNNLIESLSKSTLCLNMFSDALCTIKWNSDRMESCASNIELYATEYAEKIATQYKINYKEAHHLIGAVLSILNNENDENFENALKRVLVQNDITHIDIDSVLPNWNVSKSIATKKSTGGVSQESIINFKQNCETILESHLGSFGELRTKHNSIEQILNTELNKKLHNEFSGIKFTLKV